MEQAYHLNILSRTGPLQKIDNYRFGVATYLTLDQDLVISAGTDNRIRIWNWITGKEEKIFFADSHFDIQCMAISKDKTQLATGHGSSGGVHMWDLITNKLIWCFPRKQSIHSVAFNADDSKIYMKHAFNTIMVFDAQDGKHLQTINDNPNSSSLSTFSMNGNTLYYFDARVVRAMQTETGKELWGTSVKGNRRLILSHDGKYLALLNSSKQIQIVRTSDGAMGPLLDTDSELMGEVDDLALCFTHDNYHILLAHGGKHLQLWNIADQTLCIEYLLDDDSNFKDIIILADNQRFALGQRSGINYLGELSIPTDIDRSSLTWEPIRSYC
ncbi:hypothetical protein MNBD_GAMMA12-1910 [hydrothermal vent metagenome]|uniref:Uncharacterized protein n=1 Tax=hydrothermal vent metagenome TaxID=652676 RepID=A0A3B0Z5Z3_9ZZZZ